MTDQITSPAKVKESLIKVLETKSLKEHLIEARQMNMFLKQQLHFHACLNVIFIVVLFGLGIGAAYQASLVGKYKAEAQIYKERITQLELESVEATKLVAHLETQLKPIREMVRKSSLYAQKYYGIGKDQADLYAATLMDKSLEKGVPYLVAFSIAIRESTLNPDAISPNGCCSGIMQVNYYSHYRKLGFTRKDLFDPVKNIDYGTSILQDYIAQGGGVYGGLKRYRGHPTDPAINEGYANMILNDAVTLKSRLRKIT